jgi:homoserine kinase
MLNDLAATVENLGPGFEAFGHAIERVLVFETGDRANVVRASRT